MIACPTPRNSQVTARKAGAIHFSHQIWIVFLTVLHSEVWLLSTHSLPHFGLSVCNPWWSVASTNAVRHLLIQHEDNSTSRQFNKKQLNKIQLNFLPTEHIAIQQVLFQQHPSLNFRTTQQMQPPCSGKIRMSFQVQIWLANSKISCKIA